jgi:predicted amidophosphoribosyltransferase
MAKISRIKCKFCGTYLEKNQTECPSCGKSKSLAVATCVDCGAKYGVDPRDSTVGYCVTCEKKKSKKKVLIKVGIMAAVLGALIAYRLLKIYAP